MKGFGESVDGHNEESEMSDAVINFARWIIKLSFNDIDTDSFDIQEKALKLGLLIAEGYDPKVHGENEVDAEKGDRWLVFSDLLALTTSPQRR